tara:strand:+ start:241634 stop:242194 length:561 start_codon:yes stop_codon:yes gene_type:complete
VIGLYSPREQSGKSTIVRFIETQVFAPNNQPMVNIKISAPLKQPLYDLGLSEEEVEGKLKEVPHPKLGGLTPRQVMINAYKSGAEKDGPDWLSKHAAGKILDAIQQGYVVIVDDVRTPEDYAMIRLFSTSSIWRIYRPKVDAEIGDIANIEGMLEDKFFDLRIDNDGTIGDLYRRLRNFFRFHGYI